MTWENKKFIDFIQLQRGHDLTKEQFVEGPYPVVSSTSVMGYHKEYKAEGPGVVIGRSGTLGKAQYINDNYWPHNTALYVKDYKGNYPLFVYYFLTDFATDKHGGGSAVPTLNRNNLSAINIKVPDISIQRRIAGILSAYDDLIENNQKQIRLLEEAAMRLYKEWFVHLRFPGHETTKIVDGVPEGWQLGKLEELIEVKYGKDHKKVVDGDIPVYGSGGLMRKCNRFLHDGESVLIPRKGSLNHIMYVNEKFWTVDTMFFTQMKCNNIALYIYFFMCSFDMYSMNIGAAVPSMTTNTLKGLDILIPEETLLESFDNIVQICFQRIAVLKNQNEKAKLARDKLLPKLMSGEIEV